MQQKQGAQLIVVSFLNSDLLQELFLELLPLITALDEPRKAGVAH